MIQLQQHFKTQVDESTSLLNELNPILYQSLENFRKINVVAFDEDCAKIFQDLKSQKIRIGTMDLKIASIALSRKAILVSRNLKDFENVPNLVVKDWSR